MATRRERRKKRRRRDAEAAVTAAQDRSPRLPSHLQTEFASAGLKLAMRELETGHWRRAVEFAETAREADADAARAVIAEASSREAKRAALKGDFAGAERYVRRALELRPGWPEYQERRRLIAEAKATVLRDIREPLFPDTIGRTRNRWWEYDLLAGVRGWNGTRETVPAPLIMEEIQRPAVAGVYAVGIYQHTAPA